MCSSDLNTQQAIEVCAGIVAGEPNPVIVLISDGTPTACNPIGSTFHSTGRSSFNCNGSGQSAQDSAEDAADSAWENGIDVIPVVINSVETDFTVLQNLARCQNTVGPCSKYFGIEVSNFDEVTTIVDDIIELAACV